MTTFLAPPLTDDAARQRLPLWRAILFRVAAVLLGLAPLAALEGVLALGDWGRPDPGDDPFVGFSRLRPLFVRNVERDVYQTAPDRRRFFAHEEFAAVKPTGGFRIFCLGGSTVQGNPYSIETSFATFLEFALREADPSVDWEVVNCGGISYASYRLVPILQECLNYEPDLIIICSGHNEFLEDRTYGRLRRIPRWLERPLDWLARRRTVSLAERGARRLGLKSTPVRAELGPEVDPILDYYDSLQAFHRDPDWADGVAQHYESNLRRMIDICRARELPVLLVRPTSNLNGCPPFKSDPDSRLSPAQREQVAELVSAARACCAKDLPGAIRQLERAVAIDPLQALAWYELGQCREAAGDFAGARAAYVRARDEDVCPLRMTSPLEEALAEVAADRAVPFLDAHDLLERRAMHGILGGYWLVDHVHPSFEGHQLIALELARMMQRQGLVTLPPGWSRASEAAFAAHLNSLSRSYFHEGQRKLEALRGWTRGYADGPLAKDRFPARIRSDR